MKEKSKNNCCDDSTENSASDNENCCSVESIVSMDDRGQIVLPKDLRAKMNLNAGDKLAIISWQKNGAVCCLSIIKADEMASIAQNVLGPMMKGVI